MEEFICSFGSFSSQFGVGIVSYARITIIHGYFIAITFAGSLEDIWTLGLAALCSNSFLGTRQMLMHEKPWVTPIFEHVRPARIQISLHILAVWSKSSLGTFWIAKDANFFQEDSDKTGLIRKLIWVFVGYGGMFSHVADQMFISVVLERSGTLFIIHTQQYIKVSRHSFEIFWFCHENMLWVLIRSALLRHF